VAIIYLALVGMVEKFEARHLVSDWLNLGKLLLALPPLLAGYLATRPRVEAGQRVRPARGPAVTAGLVSGVLTGLVAALGVAFVQVFPPDAVRNIFIAVSPTLIEIMTFGKGLAVGAVLLVVAGAMLAFALSFDEVIVTTFTSGAQNTLPIWIFGAIRLGQRLPEVNVVVSFVILVTIIPVVIAARLTGGSGVARVQAGR